MLVLRRGGTGKRGVGGVDVAGAGGVLEVRHGSRGRIAPHGEQHIWTRRPDADVAKIIQCYTGLVCTGTEV